MKRRDFLRSAGAAAIVPALPMSSLATPAAATQINTVKFGWAALLARVHDQASPALIQKWIQVGPDQAQALMAELVKRNIVNTPIAGTATAVQPMYAARTVPGTQTVARKMARTAKDVIKDALKVEDEPTEPAPHDTDPTRATTHDLTPSPDPGSDGPSKEGHDETA